ncbi:hypothetical protein GFL78_37205 [Rhizobium leguminosarum bv. viciae]|nr:hypothetical protein [Rhizobium leguminosarum bv. viciae]
MNFKQIGRELLTGSRRRDDGLITAYEKRFREISESVQQFSGLKSRLMVTDNRDALDLIRFSAFANDLTRLYLEPSNEMKIRLPPLSGFEDGLKLTFRTDNNYNLQIIDGRIQASPAFVLRSDAFAKRTINAIAPLMMHGKVIVEPVRGILIPDRLPTPDGKTQWNMLTVDENSPFNEWTLDESRKPLAEASIPLVQSANLKVGERKLYEVSIPFLSGIGFVDLAKVLEDENHHLADARLALRTIIDNAESDVSTIINDVLRPKLDALERRFKLISSSHHLKQGSALFGTATVALMAYATGGIPQVISAVAGAGGLGVIAKQQVEASEKRAAIKEDPLYLLWRLRSIRRDR